MEKNLKELSNTLNERTAAKLNNDLKQISESLTTVSTSNLAKLPKSIFDNEFRDYLSGKKVIEEDSTLIATWVKFAGGPYNGVDIIDGKGNVIDTTPPLVNTVNVDQNIINSGFSSLLSDIANTNPAFKGNIDKKSAIATDMIEKNLKINNDDEWNNFFNRLDSLDNSKTDSVTNTKTTIKLNENTSEYNYED